MFDDLVTTALCAQGPVAVELWTRVENAACAHRLHAMRTMLEAAMSADGSVDRDQWCIDNWSAVCAHIGAAQRLTTRSVSATLLVALAPRERFPRLEALFTDGRLSYPIVRLITTRASAVIDPAVWEALDIALSARFTGTDYPTSLYRAQKAIDAEIWRLDPAAVHRTQTRAQGRRVDVTIDDETGIAQLYASLFATDGAAFTTRPASPSSMPACSPPTAPPSPPAWTPWPTPCARTIRAPRTNCGPKPSGRCPTARTAWRACANAPTARRSCAHRRPGSSSTSSPTPTPSPETGPPLISRRWCHQSLGPAVMHWRTPASGPSPNPRTRPTTCPRPRSSPRTPPTPPTVHRLNRSR
ncbi:DUF222 domain-containing protein [Mycolicibacterium madagascariense]|nr:13E12 repeat family protein [Mycolicibacterium madagascariense]MCV7012050.1 DUF222 domain-containing protein [Mycolicibacterium madagascariense]